MQSVKTYTGYCCNGQLGREGAFWQEESYDHCVRDADELERITLLRKSLMQIAGSETDAR